jgi:hypothetical protein
VVSICSWPSQSAITDGIVTVTGLAARTGPDEIGEMKLPPNPNYRHRFPVEIISQLSGYTMSSA